MKIIVLHERFSNEPVIIRVDAINVIFKRIDRVENSNEEYSELLVGNSLIHVKEHIEIIMGKIKTMERAGEQNATEGTK